MPTVPVPLRTHPLICAAVLVLLLGACGQKGALYHAEPSATSTPAEAPAQPPVKKKDEKQDATDRDSARAPR